jgi:uncharacterized membrane protein YbhN (UPF0104 family)
MTQKSIDWRSILRWPARLITLGLLVWVAWRQDWKALGDLFTTRNGILVLAASVSCMLIGQVFASQRWVVLLRIENPVFPFWRAFRLTLIGAFASLFLPTTAGGDIVRIASLDDRDRVASVSVVAMDRIISFLSVVFLLPFSLLILYPHLHSSGVVAAWAILGATEPGKIGRFFSPVMKFLGELKSSLFSWRKHPWRLTAAFFLALGSNAFSWFSVWMLARELNIQATYWQIAAAGVWIYAVGLLPIAINGLGIQEASYVYIYEVISNTSASLSATLGLLTRLVYILAILPGGIWLLLKPEIRQSLRKPGA